MTTGLPVCANIPAPPTAPYLKNLRRPYRWSAHRTQRAVLPDILPEPEAASVFLRRIVTQDAGSVLPASGIAQALLLHSPFRTTKKGAAKNLTAPYITKPLTSNRKQTAFFIVTLPSTGMSQKLVTFSITPHPLPYPLRTGGRPDTYTPASAALPSQPLYQAAFERVRGLHSLTT